MSKNVSLDGLVIVGWEENLFFEKLAGSVFAPSQEVDRLSHGHLKAEKGPFFSKS